MDFDAIKNYLDSCLINYKIPSFDICIMRDHKELFRYYGGSTLGDEKYLMYSMTKVSTMTAFMQLVEEGKISLEDDVSKYLPAYENIMVKDEKGSHKAKNKLKIWHLLSMQSGLDYDLKRAGIERILKEKGDLASTREIVDSFVETPFDFEPGTHFQYSLSHDVAAAIIEVVSGMSFGEYLKEKIFKPLHMDKTIIARPINIDVKGLCDQFDYDEPNNKIVPIEKSCIYALSPNYESGGAGLISTLSDYSILADTLASGGISKDGTRLLKPETIEIMKKNLLSDIARDDLERTMGKVGYDYGCGVAIFNHPEKVSSPARTGLFGWDGSAGSVITMDTATKTSFVFMLHVRGFRPAWNEIHPVLRDMIFSN